MANSSWFDDRDEVTIEIASFKIGSDYRFSRDEIEKWIAENERLSRRSK
jgi:hypothetical protein